MLQFLKILYYLKFPFSKRFVPSLIKRFFFSKVQIVYLDFGKVKVDLSQAIDREIYLNEFYEKEQLMFLHKIYNERKINHFFDIGANIGYYSLFFQKVKNIHAFEPNKKTDVNLTLQGVNHTFKKGHKVQIQIQSTWFPLIDRNPQTYVDNIFEAEEEDFQKQPHTIYGDSAIKFSVLEVTILLLEVFLSTSYFNAIPVKGSLFETTKSKAAFALSKSNS